MRICRLSSHETLTFPMAELSLVGNHVIACKNWTYIQSTHNVHPYHAIPDSLIGHITPGLDVCICLAKQALLGTRHIYKYNIHVSKK